MFTTAVHLPSVDVIVYPRDRWQRAGRAQHQRSIMRGYSGEFIASLLIALVLSWVASLVIAYRYRSAMRRLMMDGPAWQPSSNVPL
jgi:hypothetical protein